MTLLDVPADQTESRQLVQELNHVRRQHGLEPLAYSLVLSRGARRWSRHLYRMGALVHATGIRGRWRLRGEVLSHGYAHPIRAWLESPPHRAIVLARWPTTIGAGKVDGYWTARFVSR